MEATAWQRVAARIARLFFLRVNTRAATQVEGHEGHAVRAAHRHAPEHVAQQKVAAEHEQEAHEKSLHAERRHSCVSSPTRSARVRA